MNKNNKETNVSIDTSKLTVKTPKMFSKTSKFSDDKSKIDEYDFTANSMHQSQSNIANFTMKNQTNPTFKHRSSMSNILASDFYKLGHMKSIIIMPILMFALILLNYALFWFQSTLLGGEEGPIEMLIPNLVSGKDMLFGASGYTSMGFFVAIICGIFIGGEFSTGTMRTLVARGSDRYKIYFSKLIVLSTLVAIFTLGAFVICGIFTSIEGYGSAFTAYDFGILIRSIVLQVLVNISIASVFIMISFLLRSKSSAMGVSLAIYFLTSILVSILFMFSLSTENSGAWLGEIVKYIPSQQLQNASSSVAMPIADLMRVIFVPIAYIFLTSIVGISTFLKRDIK